MGAAPKIKTADCVICGKTFEKVKGCQVTCSEECRRARKAETNRKYRQANPEKRRQMERRYRQANPEYRQVKRKWRQANPEKCRQIDRKYRHANSEKLRLACRKWQKTNPEKYRQSLRKWQRANPEKYQAYRRNRRQFLRAASLLGLPPLLYAAMKIKDHFSQSAEQSHAPDPRPDR